MQHAIETRAMQVLAAEQVEQVSGGDTFGYWVGKLAAWSSVGGIALDVATGGAYSNSVGNAVSAAEDWVNGK